MVVGWVWGEQFPTDMTGEKWNGWKLFESATPANYSGDYGKLLINGENISVSPVMDMNSTREKQIELKYDQYETGFGSGSIWYRVSDTPFNQQDNETVGPIWELYEGMMIISQRYMQIRTECG